MALNKKVIASLVLIISILMLAFFCIPDSKKFNELIVDNETYQEIIENRTQEKIDASISFNEYALIMDNNNNLYYSLIEEYENKYNPNVLVDKQYDIAVLENEISNDIISNNEKIKVLVYDEKTYDEYYLICTTLPILDIEAKKSVESEEDVKAKLTLFDNGTNELNRLITSDCLVHIRGSYYNKYAFPKYSYKLTLTSESLGNNRRENNISLLGIEKTSDYVLYSGCYDRERVRQVFSSTLWQEGCANNNMFDINNCSEFKNVEVIINGEYSGLYCLGNKINSDTLNLKDGEISYKRSIDPEEESLDLNKYGIDEKYTIHTSSSDDIGYDVLDDYYNLLTSTYNPADIYNSCDIGNAVDMYLFVQFVQGQDHFLYLNQLNNIYLTSKIDANNNRRMLYTLWDFDRTYGLSSWKNQYFDYDVDVGETVNPVSALLKMNNENIKNYIRNRYNELRNGAWSNENLFSLIDKYEAEVYDSGAFLRELERWDNTDVIIDCQSYKQIKLEDFRKFVGERAKYVDELIENMCSN